MCDKVVCQRKCESCWCSKLCQRKCDKLLVRDKVVCERWYVTKMVCDRREAGGGGRREATRDTESKTRTPHKVAGKKTRKLVIGKGSTLCSS